MRTGREGPRVVAFGGGHGLSGTLSALRRLTDRLTAVVTVADDGGSSGRLRDELGVLPLGDLRMALAALASDDEWGRQWTTLLQHRFDGDGPLAGHAVGNLLLAALTDTLGDPVAALAATARVLGLPETTTVLPLARVPLDILAEVLGVDPDNPGAVSTVRGQVAVATTTGRVLAVHLDPLDPPGCPEAVAAVAAAEWVVLGPGSLFTSLMPHLLVPDVARALVATSARRVLVLNLAPQTGETAGFSPEAHLFALLAQAPDLRLDAVLADVGAVPDPDGLARAARPLGARLVLAPLAVADGSPRHDPARLAEAYADLFDSDGLSADRAVADTMGSGVGGARRGSPTDGGGTREWR